MSSHIGGRRWSSDRNLASVPYFAAPPVSKSPQGGVMATTTVSAPAQRGELLSERIAPGILPKVLGPFDMVAIFVAIVLFAVQGSVVQQAGASAFVYWILGFLPFLIPGAIVTGQLGLMFPGEGSI